MKNYFPFLIAIIFFNCSCNSSNQESVSLKKSSSLAGLWLGKLEIKPGKYLPFNFEITKDSIFFVNGQEKISGLIVKSTDSTFKIKMPIFNSEFNFILKDDNLEGEWINQAKGPGYIIPFCATRSSNINHRFSSSNSLLSSSISGKWEVDFAYKTQEKYKAIGVFKQEKNNLTGTFITETGDYRYLQGNSIKDSIFLSCFDGSHAFLFEAKLENEALNGVFYSGKHYQNSWKAHRNSSFSLSDPDSITKINPEFPVSFSFPDLDSNIVSFPSSLFNNKVLIVQIIGSWCPNCLDETAFFNALHKKYNSSGLEVISLTYEQSHVFSEKVKSVKRLKNHFKADFPFLIAGNAGKKDVEYSLPFLKNVASFPTTLYIDRNGVVRKIHSGFYGPGTGEFYSTFSAETSELIEQLLQEKPLN